LYGCTCAALLVTAYLVAPTASAQPETPDPAEQCADNGPHLRYVVLFAPGTEPAEADAEITAGCGATTAYYPQIGVAIATSADPGFGDRFGPSRAVSAQRETLARRGLASPDLTAPNLTLVGDAGRTDLAAEQWDMTMIGADRARLTNPGDHRVVVGVLDSGIDADHPELAEAVDPSLSAGCLTGAPDPTPSAWAPTVSPHGTHVAGTIAAADDGVGITGVAPGVRLAAIKVVDDDGHIYPEYVVCGFMWAAEHGIRVTNNSYVVDPWSLTCRDRPREQVAHEAVRRAVTHATSRGVLTVAATGNDGLDLARFRGRTVDGGEEIRWVDNHCDALPAELPGVVGVAAVGPDRVKTSYSSYGLGVVDVVAPGGDSDSAGGKNCVLSTVPGGYDHLCGTSMATPHVSGVAALLASTHPDATPDQLTRLLGEQATPLPCPEDYDRNADGVQDAVCHGSPEFNGFHGHGMVNALAAVSGGTSTPVDTTATPTGTTTSSEEVTPR